jgi:Plasmid pRiA4b ORF-3-like protein
MFVYKFRVLLEDQDDFLRDIEIGSKQTYGDFHKALITSVNLDGKELSSFFVCDSKWKKLKEITLIDMGDNSQEPPAKLDEDEIPEPAMPVFVMDNVRIKDMIDDPHQRIIFEYDFLNPRTFYIELLKINEAKPDVEYPVCVKQQGQLTSPAVPFIFDADEVEIVDEAAMLQELNEMVDEGQLDTESSDEAPPVDLPW